MHYMGVSQIRGTFLGPYTRPYIKDYSILGSILGSPYIGKLPCRDYIGTPFPYSLLGKSNKRQLLMCRWALAL